MMNLAVEVPTTDTARGDDEHCHEGHVAVDRAKPEIRVPENQYSPQHAKDHMGPEPEGDRPHDAQGSHSFSQGICQQQEHKEAACKSQPITNPALWCQAVVVSIEPADAQGGDNSDAESQGDHPRPPTRTVFGEICYGARPRMGCCDRRAVVTGPPAGNERLYRKVGNC